MEKTRQFQPDNTNPSLRASAFTPLLQHFGNHPERLKPVLAAHGLSLEALRDPYTIVPLSAFLAVLEDAACVAGEPSLGAMLGLNVTPADLGPAGVLLAQSSTLRRGLQRFNHSLAALQGATEMTFEVAEDIAHLSYQFVSKAVPHTPQDTEFTFSCICQVLRSAFSQRWQPLEVQFQHAEVADQRVLRRVFRAPLRFSQPVNRILISVDGLDQHHRDEDAALVQIIERHVSDLAGENDLCLSDRVALIVARRLGRVDVDVKAIARELGLAPRTFQRRLAREGVSLRHILRAHRMRSARMQLDRRGACVTDIAQVMGYSDATAFGRAYRGWFGQTPKGKP